MNKKHPINSKSDYCENNEATKNPSLKGIQCHSWLRIT